MNVLNVEEETSATDGHICNHQTIGTKLKTVGKTIFSWKVIKPTLYGQGLSLLICGTAITSTYLVEDYNANVPLTQILCNYVLLAVVYGTLLLVQKDENDQRLLPQALKNCWWQYLVISIADVAANYLIVSAYQYTSLTSVQVLDCFVIIVVMLLSWFVLKTRYKIVHFVGVGIALVGVAFMIIADVLLRKGNAGSNPLLGDVMVLGGATCYGISNVGMEYFVKRRTAGHTEILGMFGIFGSTITGILVACLERNALQQIEWALATWALFIGFALCMFLLYSLMPLAMKLSSATTVNLSMLTADLYALFVGIFLFSYQFSPMYIVSFIVITLSLIIYNSKPQSTLNVEENVPEVEGAADNNGNAVTLSDTSETYLLQQKSGTWFSKKEHRSGNEEVMAEVEEVA